MKYFFKIVLTLILASATILGVYYYTNGKSLPTRENQINLTTVSKPPATEKYANKRLLASVKKQKYYLYTTDDKILLVHGDKEFEFNPWSSYIDLEKPKMYVFDADGDGKKDVIVSVVGGTEQSTGDFVYDLYILRRSDGDEEDYELVTANQSNWHTILDSAVVEELTQLKTCKKYVQFAMTIKGKQIEYGKKTGIVTKNAGYVGYARALQDDSGSYMTVEKWNKGKGSYYINEENKICCEVEVIIKYKDSDVTQKAGKIYFENTLDHETGNLYITSGTMVFTPFDEYKISNPKSTAKSPWSVTLNNSAKAGQSEAINWVKYSFDIDPATLTQTQDLSAEETDIRFVNTLTVSESALVMTAKEGFTFDSSAAEAGEFSLTINKGQAVEYEISYIASVSEDGRTLTISFDKSYPQSEIKTIAISYGSK